jgi:hypothetical protein
MKRISVFVCLIVCLSLSLGISAENRNDWVKYADDKSTSYSIDRNSIFRNNSGNYYVLILMVPYKNNAFNTRLKRSDIAYVYSEQEVDVTNSLHRVISLHLYNKDGKEIASDAYSLKGIDVPNFENIVKGSVTDSLKKYVVNYSKDRQKEK